MNLFTKMDPLLEGVINRLRGEVQQRLRQHELTEKNSDPAPKRYQSAVADYFEQLSRDYEVPKKSE